MGTLASLQQLHSQQAPHDVKPESLRLKVTIETAPVSTSSIDDERFDGELCGHIPGLCATIHLLTGFKDSPLLRAHTTAVSVQA